MKLSLLLSAALALLAAASPLIDVERTELSLERSKEQLDNGKVVMHLSRVDDLLDEDKHLLLERKTHIALQIQLDVNNAVLDVNGNRLPLIAGEDGTVAVAAFKAESFALPTDLPAAFYEPEHVQRLVDSLSKGIVGVKVRVESETVPVKALAQDYNQEEDAVAIQKVDNVSMRKIGIFVVVEEVEGQMLHHTETIVTPILQLLIATKAGESGLTISRVSTLTIGDQPVEPTAVFGHDMRPTLSHLLPLPENEQELAAAPIWKPSRPSSGILGALRSLFDQPKSSVDNFWSKTKKPCAGAARNRTQFQIGRQGHALSEKNGQHSRTHKKPCFFGRLNRGLTGIGHFLRTNFEHMYLLHSFLAFFVFASLFKVVRKVVKARRARRDMLPAYEEVDSLFSNEDEKLYAVYVVAPPESAMPLFDADVEDEKH